MKLRQRRTRFAGFHRTDKNKNKGQIFLLPSFFIFKMLKHKSI